MLPARYLHKKGWRQIKLLDMLVLLRHVKDGASTPGVGFEDANSTYEQLFRTLNKNVWIEQSVLESALWSCNLMDEKKLFDHPRKLTFDEWVKQLLGSRRFNKLYNFIDDRGEKDDA